MDELKKFIDAEIEYYLDRIENAEFLDYQTELVMFWRGCIAECREIQEKSSVLKVKRKTNMDMDKIKDFYEMEYKDTIRTLENPYWEKRAEDVIKCSLQRCLGVAFFVQGAFDISFDDINKLYEEYKEKIERLINDV